MKMEFEISNENLFINGNVLDLDNIKFIEEIGFGANAKVFKVENSVTDRDEVIKIWKPWKHQKTVSPEKFEAEIKKNAKFSRVNGIATIFTGGIKDGIYYALMEYIEGPVLEKYLDGNNSFENRYRILSKVLETIKTVLKMGYFHGDLHHGNIIINNENENLPIPIIIDFGTSYFSGEKKSHRNDAEKLYKLCFEIIPEFEKFEFIEKDIFYNDYIFTRESGFVCEFFKYGLNLLRDYMAFVQEYRQFMAIEEGNEYHGQLADMKILYLIDLSNFKNKFGCLNDDLLEAHIVSNSLDLFGYKVIRGEIEIS